MSSLIYNTAWNDILCYSRVLVHGVLLTMRWQTMKNILQREWVLFIYNIQRMKGDGYNFCCSQSINLALYSNYSPLLQVQSYFDANQADSGMLQKASWFLWPSPTDWPNTQIEENQPTNQPHQNFNSNFAFHETRCSDLPATAEGSWPRSPFISQQVAYKALHLFFFAIISVV